MQDFCLMISFRPSSSLTSIIMRAFVSLCLLLHSAFGQYSWDEVTYPWDGPQIPVTEPPTTADYPSQNLCLLDQASCGCCLMKKQIYRMEWFFNHTLEELHKEMWETKMIVNDLRASRSAFSVALNDYRSMDCFGPFDTDKIIPYEHVFINLGDGYSVQDGIFTAPRSGLYSFSVTVYATGSSDGSLAACATLLVNGEVVSALLEQNGQDFEDSGTIVTAIKLMANDKVAVNLPKGCVVCDHYSHYNTFTGFLLYATD